MVQDVVKINTTINISLTIGRTMKNLKYLRELHGMSQTQLANLLSISKNTILNWENGDRQPPFEAIARVAQHFGISLDDFAFKDMEVEELGGDKVDLQALEGQNIVIRAADFPTYCTAGDARFHSRAIIPGIEGKARTFEIASDGMVPLLNYGDWVACLPVEDVRSLEDGRVFVVVTASSEVLVGYGQSYKEGVKVMPHNLAGYTWQVIPYGQVYEVWQVKVRVTKYFMLPYVVGEVGRAQLSEPREGRG
jgi:transcriptional regulator with XRE-family HTH domain